MTIHLEFKIKKTVAFVFEYLTDMQKFVRVHPIIYKIDKLQDNKYLIFEKLKIGFIPYSFTYFATVASDFEQKTVVIKAVIMKIVHVEMLYTITSENDYAIINETINLKTILPIKSIMKSIFQQQHELLFKNIEQILV